MSFIVRPARISARSTTAALPSQKSHSWIAPTLGIIANGNISTPQPGTAVILDNWFCKASSIVMRRGKNRYATLGDETLPARSIFSYVSGNKRKIFATTDAKIYNITQVYSARNVVMVSSSAQTLATDEGDVFGWGSTAGLDEYASTNGNWFTVQTQASSGDTYLIGVNGVEPSFVYDGDVFFPQVAGGVYELPFSALSGAFQNGDTVTGATSGATGKVYRSSSDSGSGSMWLTDIASGPFQSGEAITGAISGSATVDAVAVLMPGTSMTFAGGADLTTADLDFCWQHKNRLFFVQKDSLNAWYLPVGQISGELTRFSLGGQFKLGGSLTMGATWSRDTGSGLYAMCAFFSSEGEVAVYQGDNPGAAETWTLVGVYKIGKPRGKRSVMDAGGDLLTATDIGLIPLSRALAVDFAVLGAEAVSEGIIDLWNEEIGKRPVGDWNVAMWSTRQMVVVSLPQTDSHPARWLVTNAKTRGWSTYSGWSATCLHVFEDELYFGDETGAVYKAEQTGLDDGKPYTATCVPTFDQMNVVGNKEVSLLRPVIRCSRKVMEQTTSLTDYNLRIPAPPPGTVIDTHSVWGGAKWGESKWGGANAEKFIIQNWRAAFGDGEVHSAALQITSGSIAPLDAELIRIDATFTSGGIVV